MQLTEVNYPVRKNPNMELQLDKTFFLHWDLFRVQTPGNVRGFCLLSWKITCMNSFLDSIVFSSI